MFEEVRHPSLAIPLVSRADKVRDVDRRLGLTGIGEQKNLKSVL